MAEEKDVTLQDENNKEEKSVDFFKNKYLITILVFLVWIVFFDQNNLIDQYRSIRQLNKMKGDIEYYMQKITEDSLKIHELLSDDENLEKYAREEYFMKKEQEDVFIIDED